MLFGPCVQDSTATFLSGAASLCSGGAGFVTAVIATLAANAKTQPAKVLRGEVPVVDTLAVRIVTDNIVIQFVPNEKCDGLTIERRGGNSRTSRRVTCSTANGACQCTRSRSRAAKSVMC